MNQFTCKRCGNCCRSTFFALMNTPYDKDEREVGKWAMYHGVETARHRSNGIDYLAISLPGDCKYLIETDGVCSCKIHNDRPIVCKDYYCKKAQGE